MEETPPVLRSPPDRSQAKTQIQRINEDYQSVIELSQRLTHVDLVKQYRNMSEHLSLNAYRDPNRVLFELLQNSEDAPYSLQGKKTLVLATIEVFFQHSHLPPSFGDTHSFSSSTNSPPLWKTSAFPPPCSPTSLHPNNFNNSSNNHNHNHAVGSL